jgi:DNA mismatch repair protein MutH
MPEPPRDEAELLRRARGVAGRRTRDVAARFGIPVPPDLRRQKGWIGQLLEGALGASAGSRAQPDFPQLSIEMKSIPVTPQGRPRESTYVCTAPMGGQMARRWEESWVRRKLSRVLWVPVVTGKGVAPGDRIIGTPFLWSPNVEESHLLQRDWESLTGLIAMGELWQLDASHGEVLQLRPKASRATEHTWLLDDEGNWVRDTKRGFYLRPTFTRAILARHLRLPG